MFGEELKNLSLDNYGRVVLCDEFLARIEGCRLTVSAGANSTMCGNTTNGACTNTYSCNNTSNNSCSNQLSCGDASNVRCPSPKEIDP